MDKIDWNDEDYIHYFYKITNINNKKYYYGIHSLLKSENKTPDTDGYLGSGIDIQKAVAKEGRENFTKEIIKTFSTREEASNYEAENVTMKEVNDPNCYNRIPGGDGYSKSMIGKVVCRLKTDINKIVILTKEEYYNNKDKYVTVGHLNYFLNGSKSIKKGFISKIDNKPRIKRTRSKKEKCTNYNIIKWYVNKNTLEQKKIIGGEEPENLYTIWFPIYFLDKKNNKFISAEYFSNLYKNTPNLEKLSSNIGISRHSLKKIKDFYEKEKGINFSINTIGKGGHIKTKGFSGKRYINNGIEELIVNNTEIENFLKKGYILGKLKLLNKNDIIDWYTQGNSISDCAKKFKVRKKTY